MKKLLIMSLSLCFLALRADVLVDKIKPFLPDNPVILEAGSYNGKDTKKMAELWPDGFVHAFEPVPALFQKTIDLTAGLENVACYQLALTNKIGTVSFYASSVGSQAGPSGSLHKPTAHLSTFPHVHFKETIDVDATTIDAWAEEHGVDRIDFMWLDMQGAELAALKAAPHIMKTVKVVYTEVSGKQMYAGTPLYGEVTKWFKSQGFSEIKIEKIHGMGNTIYVRTELLGQ